MSILIGRDTRLVVHGITGREGEFHSRQMLEYGTHIVAGMTPGKGGLHALDNRVPVFDTIAEAVARDRRQHLVHLRPGRRRPGLDPRGGRRRHLHDLLHHRGDPGPRHAPGRRGRAGGGRPPDRAELPRRDLAGPGQGRDHPGLDPPRGHGRRRVALRHAHLRGRPGDDRRRDRPERPASASAATRSSGRPSSTSSSCSRPTPRPRRSC